MRSTITLYVCDKCGHEDTQPMNCVEMKKANRLYQEKIAPRPLDLCDNCFNTVSFVIDHDVDNTIFTEAADVRE